MINTIILGHVLNVLPQLPAESVSCVTCSPPYWGLRDYGIEPVIWDGDKDCKHDFITKERRLHSGSTKSKIPELSGQETDWVTKDGFCLKCGAWRGSLGLEPTFELYIKHLCDIFDEVKRVLRKDGTCWVNLGDSYSTSPAGNKDQSKETGEGWFKGRNNLRESNIAIKQIKNSLPAKSLCDIPYRFSIEMINRGWIKRNTIIWHKPNCMPSSADDRFTVDFEYLFFFTKNNKAIFWTNKKTLECVDKKPLGIKGIEGKDWEWRETQDWKEEESAGYKIGATDSHRAASIGGLKLGAKHKKSGKLKKVSFWSGHDYWFEQQFEKMADVTLNDKRAGNDRRGKGWKDYKKEGISGGIEVRQRIFNNLNPNGRNKRCVWIIPTQSFPEAHFAVYPEGLIEIPIKAGCPEFVCKKCGKARVKILEPTEEYKEYLGKGNLEEHHAGQETKTKFKVKANAEYKFRGYSDCGCNAGFESGIVLDPFMGAGTTALVALKQRKRFIGIEIKQEYINMAKRRIAKVQQKIF